MDDVRFDTLTRALGALADRRAAARMLTAGSLGLLALLAGHDAEAKKKKKKGKKKKKKKSGPCKSNQEKCGNACCNASQTCIAGQCLGPCQFLEIVTDTESRQLLAEDCATTETIVVRNGFILDGNGNTIHMAGPVSGYQSVTVAGGAVQAGVLIQNGTGSVKNVTIDQDALQCGGSQAHSAIVMAKGEGDVESVEIVVTNDDIQCYRGIDAEVAANNDAINVRNVTITGGHDSAMAISGPAPSDGASLVAGEIKDCTIRDAIFGMLLNATKHQVKSNEVNANFGILIGVFPSDVFIDDNTITGLTGATNPAGVLFNPNTKGTVSNNAISGFTCGVSIQDGGGPVAGLDTNTFTSNTTNVCDPPT